MYFGVGIPLSQIGVYIDRHNLAGEGQAQAKPLCNNRALCAQFTSAVVLDLIRRVGLRAKDLASVKPMTDEKGVDIAIVFRCNKVKAILSEEKELLLRKLFPDEFSVPGCG